MRCCLRRSATRIKLPAPEAVCLNLRSSILLFNNAKFEVHGGNLSEKAGLEKKDIIKKKGKFCPCIVWVVASELASCHTQANLTWLFSVISRLIKVRWALCLLKNLNYAPLGKNVNSL